MLERIAVAFGSRGDQEAGIRLASGFEQVPGSDRTCVERLDRIGQVVFGAGERGKMEDEVELTRVGQRTGNVAFLQVEARLSLELGEVAPVSCLEVVEPANGVSFGD